MGWLIAGIVILLVVLITAFFCRLMRFAKQSDIAMKMLLDERENTIMQDEQKAKTHNGGGVYTSRLAKLTKIAQRNELNTAS